MWQPVLAAVVGALPPAVAGLAVHMRALIRRESRPTKATPATPAPLTANPTPAPVAAAPTPTDVPAETAPAPATSVAPAVVPVPASAFARRNGTPLTREVTR
ncbi:hypothetical protein ABZX12_17675 [Kribbella sp. NPDC003505]|uniref:hypothetical protein n=1 Tax=Kribbella sp. NPDC003505 TaxID=3154448 RepID=UPI0033BE1321